MTWHSVNEAAPLLGLSAESVYLLISSKRLAHRRVGLKPGRGKIQISDAGIAEFLAACEVPREMSIAPQGCTGSAPTPGAKKRPKTLSVSGRSDGKPIKRDWG